MERGSLVFKLWSVTISENVSKCTQLYRQAIMVSYQRETSSVRKFKTYRIVISLQSEIPWWPTSLFSEERRWPKQTRTTASSGWAEPRWKSGRSQRVGRCAEGLGIRGARRRAGAKWWGDRSWGLVHKGRFLAEQDSKTRVLPQADTAGSTVSERLEGCTQRLLTTQWQIP